MACQKASLEPSDIQAVGVTVPSSVDYERKTIIHAPNLGWISLPFEPLLKEAFHKPAFIDNDVVMGTFGECHLGVGKGYHRVYGMFIGTGIGGGYLVNGEIVRGINEVGHHIVKMNGPRCSCGNRGCLESIAAKSGMISFMQKRVKDKGEKTILDKLAPNWKTTVGSSALRKAVKKRDKVVIRALERSAEAIGVAIGNLVTLVGVDAIILGGGIIEELSEFFFPRIKESMHANTFADRARDVELLQSTLGDDAVALGAAWFVRLPEHRNQLFV
jgi:glucokinase